MSCNLFAVFLILKIVMWIYRFNPESCFVVDYILFFGLFLLVKHLVFHFLGKRLILHSFGHCSVKVQPKCLRRHFLVPVSLHSSGRYIGLF